MIAVGRVGFGAEDSAENTAGGIVGSALHRGKGAGRHVTCDLGHAYVKLNAEYRT